MTMCLLVLAYEYHPEFPLVVAANRDEFFQRPTAAADFWPDQPHVLAGRDLEQGGTWMGVNKNGRFAALTNVRDPKSMRSSAKSRGLIVADFLAGSATPQDFIDQLKHNRGQYNGFNLIVSDGSSLRYFNSVSAQSEVLHAGIYGLSNHQLDTAWPKVTRSKAALDRALRDNEQELETLLFALLADRTTAEDSALPDSGVGLDKERWLSPVFISAHDYGTRCSTVVIAGARQTLFVERSFDSTGEVSQTGRFSL